MHPVSIEFHLHNGVMFSVDLLTVLSIYTVNFCLYFVKYTTNLLTCQILRMQLVMT